MVRDRLLGLLPLASSDPPDARPTERTRFARAVRPGSTSGLLSRPLWAV